MAADHPAVHLTRWGHSCVLVEVAQPDGSRRRLLVDPGNLTPSLTEVGPLDAVLVTHAHADHVDADQVRRLRATAAVPVHGDAETRDLLAGAGLEDLHLLAPGDHTIAGVAVSVAAAPHETIYPSVPLPGHLSYLVAGTVLAPGDAFHVPAGEVDVLLLPTGAPWMKLAEAIDYLRAVAPRVAVPVHDSGLAAAHQHLHRSLLTRFAPEGTTVVVPEVGRTLDLATLDLLDR